jgi:hypothetical protein
MNYEIDSTLLVRRKVTGSAEDNSPGIPGFFVALECGHVFWMPVRPGETIHCADCVERAALQLRGIQKEPVRAEG